MPTLPDKGSKSKDSKPGVDTKMRRVKIERLICVVVFLCALGSGGRGVAILNAAAGVGGSEAVPLRLVAFSLSLALLATSSAQAAVIPEARILSPEDGVTMLTREGALHINVEVRLPSLCFQPFKQLAFRFDPHHTTWPDDEIERSQWCRGSS